MDRSSTVMVVALLVLLQKPFTIEGWTSLTSPTTTRLSSSSSFDTTGLFSTSTLSSSSDSNNSDDNDDDDEDNVIKIQAAVLVPGFLTGADEFGPLCDLLTQTYGIPTVAVPMPNWHWLPCLGGRSSRPILERIDWTVQQLIANDGNVTAFHQNALRDKNNFWTYTFYDAWMDFQYNPGGVFRVGGSDQVDEYPIVEPRGTFPLPDPKRLFITTTTTSEEKEMDGTTQKTTVTKKKKKKIALIGHSAGGWIGRIYLSSREYGGRAYKGTDHVHSLITLGTPHATASHPAFNGIEWCNREEGTPAADGSAQSEKVLVPTLVVGGGGYKGDEWGTLTQNAYSFCCPSLSNGTTYEGDGLTPRFSSLGLPGAEQLELEDVAHFCWSDVFGGSIVAPELSAAYQQGRPWYGSDSIVPKWANWLIRQCRPKNQQHIVVDDVAPNVASTSDATITATTKP
jgi:pimeloyl-ACP methyl ester carboxylesterase